MVPVKAVLHFPVEGEEGTFDLLLSQAEIKQLQEDLGLLLGEIEDLEYDKPKYQQCVTLKQDTPLRRDWQTGVPPSDRPPGS